VTKKSEERGKISGEPEKNHRGKELTCLMLASLRVLPRRDKGRGAQVEGKRCGSRKFIVRVGRIFGERKCPGCAKE